MTSCVPWPIPAESTPEASATLLRWPSDLHSASSRAVNVRCEWEGDIPLLNSKVLNRFDDTDQTIVFLNIVCNIFLLGVMNVFLRVISPEGVPSWKHVRIWPSLPSSGTPHRSMDTNSGAVMQTSSSSQIPC